jgi:3-hydroxyacyl-CoA dehydrogenase
MKKVLIFGSGSIGNHMAFASRKLNHDVYVTDIKSSALQRMKSKIFPKRYKKWDKKINLIGYKNVFNSKKNMI